MRLPAALVASELSSQAGETPWMSCATGSVKVGGFGAGPHKSLPECVQ